MPGDESRCARGLVERFDPLRRDRARRAHGAPRRLRVRTSQDDVARVDVRRPRVQHQHRHSDNQRRQNRRSTSTALARAGDLSPVGARRPGARLCPQQREQHGTVISQKTLKVIDQFSTGAEPQHVTPSYDLRTLYVDNDVGNTPDSDRPAHRAAGESQSRSRIRTTFTSPRMAVTRSSSPSAWLGWTSATRTR